MKKLLFGVLVVMLISSCLRLDSFMFNPTQTDEYLYNGVEEDALSELMADSMDIVDSMITELVLVSNDDGDMADIYAVYIGDPDRIATDTVILYCHGNARNIDGYWHRAALLANVGGKHNYGVLMMDYRGYGRSEGTTTESGIYADVDACMKWLSDMGLSDDRLVIYGFSLGTGPATELTANPMTMTPSALVLEAPYASVNKIQQDGSVLNLPQSYFIDLKFDNAEEIKKVQQPFLWLHGEDDDFLKIEHGEVIVKNYGGTHLVTKRVPGGGHSTVPQTMGVDPYLELMYGFLTGQI
jgi:pimeloyl-ACP methyl ester carboxylesterase